MIVWQGLVIVIGCLFCSSWTSGQFVNENLTNLLLADCPGLHFVDGPCYYNALRKCYFNRTFSRGSAQFCLNGAVQMICPDQAKCEEECDQKSMWTVCQCDGRKHRLKPAGPLYEHCPPAFKLCQPSANCPPDIIKRPRIGRRQITRRSSTKKTTRSVTSSTTKATESKRWRWQGLPVWAVILIAIGALT